jgi:hypothetical protein
MGMHLKTRRVEIAGITENSKGEWIEQMARNLTDYSGFPTSSRFTKNVHLNFRS